MSALFEPFALRQVAFANRVWVSPMCQYSGDTSGRMLDWHLVHLGALAKGGASLVLCEATAVAPEGRITPWDTGIWSDDQLDGLRRVVEFVAAQGAVPGIQIAHAGRKASNEPPWRGNGPIEAARGGWTPVAPSAVAFDDGWHVPKALDAAGIEQVVGVFAAAARRAVAAGFRVVEIHAAHGYLLHSFLSPLSNRREDAWGGPLENRMRLPLAVVEAVRAAVPPELPLLVRVSATDWVDGGWDIASTIELARRLVALGVDLVDCSSGGLSPAQKVELGPGYQVPFAEAVRREAGVPTGAVGLITEAVQAEEIIASGGADAVLLARQLLRNPAWPLQAAHELGATVPWPPQYERARRS
jgi:2,4-dienoyl-CoA reductase-like NADH-dependent reductase (Old Yellow Enzyme family)